MEQTREHRNRPTYHNQFIFNKVAKVIQWSKDSLVHKWYCKKMSKVARK